MKKNLHKISLRLLLVLLLPMNALFAQTWQTPIQAGGSYLNRNVNSVYFTSTTQGWAVGDNGIILATSNGGTTWTTQTTGTGQNFLGVFFISSTQGWAVGTNGTILVTNNGGTTWTAQTSGVSSQLSSVYFISATQGWAVGSSGVILTTNNGGSTWTAQTSGTLLQLQNVKFTSATDGWIVGNGSTILVTSNGGATWTTQTGPTATLMSISFTSATQGWLVGANGNISVTNNGGTTWTSQTSGSTQFLNSVYFISATQGWAVGNNGTILVTSNGGTTWTAQTSGTTNTLQEVYFTSSTQGWAVGAAGTMLVTSNGGTTWTTLTSGIIQNFNCVYFTNATQGWAVGTFGTILVSSNGGLGWTAQTSGTMFDLKEVYFTSSTQGWAVGAGGNIVVTSNGGTTWTAQTSGTTEVLNSVYFTSANQGWAVGTAGTILVTNNGGTTWTTQTSGTTNALNTVYFTSATQGYAVGASGTILVTNNGGTTWTAQTSGTTNDLNSVYFISATQGWAVGGNTILITSNGGTTWTAQSTGSGSSLSAVNFINATQGWVSGTLGTILTTSNGGTTWTPQTSGVPNALQYVKMFSATKGWAVGTGGTILLYDGVTLPTIAPGVSTTGATSIGATNATLGGNVIDSGSAAVTERGVVYATTANPTTANTKVQIGSGLGAFSQNVTGLTAATLYHVRAYAINSVGTSYGADSTFTTLEGTSTSITGDTSSISLNKGSFSIIDNSLTITTALDSITGANVTITNGLQNNDSLWYNGSLPTGVTAIYNRTKGILTFNGKAKAADFQALLRNVTINMPSVSSNATRTVAFTLGTAIPYNGHFYETVTTPLTWVNAKAAAAARSYFGLQGYLVTIKDANENDYVRQKLSSDAWMGASDNYVQINAATGTTTYANQAASEGKWYWVTGPEAGQQFSNGNAPSTTVISGKYMNWDAVEPNNYNGSEDYGQFYSSGSGKWNDYPATSQLSYVCEYGDMVGDPNVSLSYSRNIIPIPAFAPTVKTSSPSSITFNSATLGGNVSDSGTAVVTERGIVYATTVNPTTANTKVQIGAGLGTFSQNVTGLTAATLYHVRAYAINSVGTSYGADSIFTTLPAPTVANVITGNVTSVSNTSANLAGNVIADGGASVTERGIVLATTANPTTANTKITIGSGLGNFSQIITALTPNTTYHYRAYAINSVGTSYGADSIFTTLPNPEFNKNITNAFSPDGNGTNDTWVIDNADLLDGHEITVYNIFGQVVYSQTGYNTPWDGKKDGDLVPSGEYYYHIKGSKINIKGALLIKTNQ